MPRSAAGGGFKSSSIDGAMLDPIPRGLFLVSGIVCAEVSFLIGVDGVVEIKNKKPRGAGAFYLIWFF
ncbi:hypothetical protein DOM22_11245 [Bdellovibrio sp. ZAP7]|nr:hypothetical protein DOM22_11245 [Bdellovibrio sp. ZAP7]